MGNKMCKKKVDAVDNPKAPANSTPFDRIITRLHLRPNKWKSDSHLEDKQVNRYEVKPKEMKNGGVKSTTQHIRPLSNAKSSDWTEVSLEVPSDDPIHLENPKLSIIFDNNTTPPVPPPRKHKKGIREKIESVAKSGLQALQMRKPVEEPLCVKKTISYVCPCGDPNHPHNHNHNHNHNHKHKHDRKSASVSKATAKQLEKEEKRKKNLSVISLPNYSELKLSLVKPDLDEVEKRASTNSAIFLPGEQNGKKVSPKKDYMTRCRSFGSILPNQLLDKLKTQKTTADIESDDSFGALEDWDCNILEHYNPKDSSLPRVRKPIKTEAEILKELEGQLVTEEETKPPPKPPVRRAESLLKRITRTAAENAQKRKSKEELDKRIVADALKNQRPLSVTPPPSPEVLKSEPVVTIPVAIKPNHNLSERDENGYVEHSSLMKILEKYSVEEKNGVASILDEESIPFIDENGKSDTDSDVGGEVITDLRPKMLQDVKKEVMRTTSNNYSSMTPSLVEFEKTIANPVEEFLNAERAWIIKQQMNHDMIKT